MTRRQLCESLERRRLLAIDVTIPSTDFNGTSDAAVQSAALAHANGYTMGVYAERDPDTGLGTDIYAWGVDANGNPPAGGSGTPGVINFYDRAGSQQNPDIAAAVVGGQLARTIVWQSQDQDGDGWGIYADVWNSSAGVAGGPARLINQTTVGGQVTPSIAMDAAGNFVVAWQSGDAIVARRFNANGTAAGDEFVVSTDDESANADPDVAMFADGEFAVTWTRTTSGGDADVMFRAFAADGTAKTPWASTMHSTSAGTQDEPSIAAWGEGGFLVAWADETAGQSTIYARTCLFGSPGGMPIQVSQAGDGDRSRPQIASDADGNFTVAWTRDRGGATYPTIELRAFDANRVATGDALSHGDGTSARTLFGLVSTGRGTFRDLSTVGENLGFGAPVSTAFANALVVDGTAGADKVVIVDDPSPSGITVTVNGVSKTQLRSPYAYVRANLGDGKDQFDSTASAMPMNVDGGAGDDRIFTGGGKDNVRGGDGHDYISLGGENDYAIGGSGNDSIYGGDGDDQLTGSAGGNRLYGGNGNDRLSGSNGRDFLYGEGGDDRLSGAGGNDYLDGGGGRDKAYGGDGDDSLIGGSGIDRLYGEAGNDSFIGGPGNDYLFGGDGLDVTRVPDAGDILDSVEAAG